MEELLEKLRQKANACGDKTKEDRARKGAYIDCIMEIKALKEKENQNDKRYTKPFEDDGAYAD